MNNFQKFISNSQNKFKDLFDYSETNYINLRTKLNLKCNKHNLNFTVQPNVHLESVSGGCPQCIKDHKQQTGNKYKLSLSDFIQRSNQIHNNKYDYSKFDYTLARNKSTVICKTHGEFEINPNNHLNGKGCPSCGLIIAGENKTKTASLKFIEQANEKHNDTYTYENFNYKKAKIKSFITCSIHGDFLCSPDNHLQGKGCPDCAKVHSKFITSKSFKSFCNKNLKGDGILYILKFINLRTNQEFLKIGITSKSIEKRYPKYLYKNYKYETLYIIKSDSEFIFKAEQSIHKEFFDFKLKVNKDFQGHSECYDLNLPILEVIKSIL